LVVSTVLAFRCGAAVPRRGGRSGWCWREVCRRGHSGCCSSVRCRAAFSPITGGAKGGGEDKEHRNKYATGEKVVDEPGRMVPLVIGEKAARQRTEEQQPE
jgi:hypothetical protein